MAETIDHLKAELQTAGWRFARNSDYPRTNNCDWYAWMPKRPQEWPDCECNDTPRAWMPLPASEAKEL